MPAPVRIMQRTSSLASHSATHSLSSRLRLADMALRASGRFSVMTATPFSATSSSTSGMAGLSGWCVQRERRIAAVE